MMINVRKRIRTHNTKKGELHREQNKSKYIETDFYHVNIRWAYAMIEIWSFLFSSPLLFFFCSFIFVVVVVVVVDTCHKRMDLSFSLSFFLSFFQNKFWERKKREREREREKKRSSKYKRMMMMMYKMLKILYFKNNDVVSNHTHTHAHQQRAKFK